MKIYREFKPLPENCGLQTAATLGTFDGVHIGHCKILKQVVMMAEQKNVDAAVLTFDRHPVSILKPDYSPKLLTTLDEKLAIFEEIGIERTFILTFTKNIAHMTAEQFLKEYLIDCLGMKYFIIGYDHGLGKGRRSSSAELKEYARSLNFNLEIIKPIKKDRIIVKSSTIRNHVLEGRVDVASTLLGVDYSFRGHVVKGRGVGKIIGFPTANLIPNDPEKIIPANGVYSGWIEIDDAKKDALITIGPRPTFNLKEEMIEIYIPDYEGNLFEKNLQVGFIRKMRNIEKFESQQTLIKQIKKDIEHRITNQKI